MSKVSLKQAVELLAKLSTNVDWDALDSEKIQCMINDPVATGRNFTRFLDNGARLQIVGNHIINCDANPFVPDGLRVESHKKGGQLQFDPSKIELYLSKSQKKGKSIRGHDLRDDVADELVLNANVLDYLFAHQELIPDSWKGKYVFFFGTVYRDSNGYLYVRCLYFLGDRWYSDYCWLDYDWNSNDPVAVSVR